LKTASGKPGAVQYVQVTRLQGAQAGLGLIGGWIEDDSDNHPHSGLKMR
jgi:putative transposase